MSPFQFKRGILWVLPVNTTVGHVSRLSSHQIALSSVRTAERCLCVEAQVMTLVLVTLQTLMYIFSIYSQRTHRRYALNDSSTKTTALTPALSFNTNNSCSPVEMHGAQTLLFPMFAANMSTQAHTDAEPRPVTHTHRWAVCPSLGRQAAVI